MWVLLLSGTFLDSPSVALNEAWYTDGDGVMVRTEFSKAKFEQHKTWWWFQSF